MYLWAKVCVPPWGESEEIQPRTTLHHCSNTKAHQEHFMGQLLMLPQSSNCWAQTSSPQACSPTDGLVLALQNSSSSALCCHSLSCRKCRPPHLHRAGSGACWAWLWTRTVSGRRALQFLNSRVSAPATALLFLLEEPTRHFLLLGVKVTDTRVPNVNTRHIHENSTELSIYIVKRNSNEPRLGKFKTPFETSRLCTMRPPVAI